MAPYGFTVQVRKYNDPRWLPIACPTREVVEAIIAESLYGSGGYHIARVSIRIGETNTFRVIETRDVVSSYVPAEDA